MQFENSKFFTYFFFVIFCLVQTSHQNFKCNQDLLLSYGLQGFETSQEIKFEMCSFIKYNCCRNEDQMKIFQNWVIDGEASNLRKRFEFYTNVYTKLTQSLEELNLIAMDMDGILNKVRVSNCKIMAFRIQQFKVKEVGKNFLDSLKKLYDFYQKSVQGFYCSLCDGTQQIYYNKHNQEIIVSKKFAREFLDKALSPLLYIHLHFVHLLNISSRFIQNCDTNGQYKDKQISRQLRFGINPKTLFMLNNCRNNRNVPKWLNYCKGVVAKFHPTRIEKFLTGNIRKLNNYVLFLKEDIKKYRDIQQAQAKKNKGAKKSTKKRKLLQQQRILQANQQQTQQTQNNQTAANTQQQNNQTVATPQQQNNQTAANTQQQNQNTSQTAKTEKKEEKKEEKKVDLKKPIVVETDDALMDKFLIESEQFENFYEDEEIIQPALNGVFNVEEFEVVVKDDGIDYLKIGKQTVIDDKVIMLIRDNNKQKIVAQEKKLEEEEKKLEEIKDSIRQNKQPQTPAQNQPQAQEQPKNDAQTPQTTPEATPQQSGFRILEMNPKKRVL